MKTFILSDTMEPPICGGLCKPAASFFVLFASVFCGLGQGIPEPSLVLYGTVRNVADNNILLKSGSLTWQFKPVGGGPSIVATATLTNINDQFSYVLFVPWETQVPGFFISPNALTLTSTPLSYDRSSVLLGTNIATLAQPSQSPFAVTSSDRGRVERVDLVVSINPVDSNGNGLPDYWENLYFGHFVDPNADPDHDGMSNLAEYRAGTDPTDPNSNFEFISVGGSPVAGVRVQWKSAEGHHYNLLRSPNLLGVYTNIATNISATAPINTFDDTSPNTARSSFYRLELQP